MIINENAITSSILHSTLLQQVRRLQQLCSFSNIRSLQQTLRLSEEIYYRAKNAYEQKIITKKEKWQRMQNSLSQLNKLKKQKKVQLSQAKEINRSLFSQLYKFRTQISEKKRQQNNGKQQSIELKKEEQRQQQILNSIESKQRQLYEKEQSCHSTQMQLQNQIDSMKLSIANINQDYNIQQINNQDVLQQIRNLNVEFQIFNNNLVSTVSQTNQEKVILHQKFQNNGIQLQQLQSQKQNQHTINQGLQHQLAEYYIKTEEALSRLKSIDPECRIIELKMLNKIQMNQSIESSLFQTKTSRTQAKATFVTLQNKLLRLKELKDQLIQIVTQF